MNRSRVTGNLSSHGNIFVDIANDRVGIGSTIPGQKLSLPDSAKIALGNSADLEIYHDGSHSYIHDGGTGNLKLRSNNFRLSNADESKISATFVPSGASELYHNNAKKFETTAYGIDVTGNNWVLMALQSLVLQLLVHLIRQDYNLPMPLLVQNYILEDMMEAQTQVIYQE